MAVDAVPIDLLRSSLDELKLRFRDANGSGWPRKAWLVHFHDKRDDRPPILGVLLDGYQDNWYLRLKPIIEDAVRLLDKLPAAVQTRLWGRPTPELPVVLMSDSDRIPQWVMAVFELLNKTGVGPPLRRVRDLPLDEKPVGFKFPPAAEWYATLPDFAAASVQAIDILQSWLDEVPKRESKAVGKGANKSDGRSETQTKTKRRKSGNAKRYRGPNVTEAEAKTRRDRVADWKRWKAANPKIRRPMERYCADETAVERRIDPPTLKQYVNWVTKNPKRKRPKRG